MVRRGWRHRPPPQPGHRHRHLPAPGVRAAASRATPVLQDLPKQSTHQAAWMLQRGWQDTVPPPPASLGHPAGKAKGKLRHDSPVHHPPQDTLQPCPRLCPQCQGRGGTQAAPPACSHTPGMAPEPARGSGPTRRHPVAELVPLGPTAAGAAPAGDSTQGRPCPDLHRPPGPRTGRGGPATPRPTGFSPPAGAAGHP